MKLLAPLLCSLGLVISGTAAAAESVEGISIERLTRLHGFMRAATGERGHLGAVTLIARNGRIVDWQAYGSQDLARRTPMAKDSIFRIRSMTKPIASVAVLMLMEEGKLALDDPVARYLPEFANAQVFAGGTADAPILRAPKRPITIRHLLTHTAGFATGAGYPEPSRLLARVQVNTSSDLATFAQRLASVPLATDPGERFSYDGVGIEAVSRLVEVVGGEPFDAFVQRRILAPLKMVDTGFSVPVAKRDRIAEPSMVGPQGRLVAATAQAPAGEPLNAYPSGAGGLYSTAGDYARFCQMLLNGGTLDGATVLGRKSVELMLMNHLTQLTPPVNEFSDAEGFGLGGFVVLDVARRGRPGSVGQFGWSGSMSTYFTIDPTEKLIAILMLQHLPQDGGGVPELPKLSVRFYNLVYQALTP
jgi:CubicO group peptidase (beta-lactamase class C family)